MELVALVTFLPPSLRTSVMISNGLVLVCHSLKTKGLRFFAVENYGNCYGTRHYSPGTHLKALDALLVLA